MFHNAESIVQELHQEFESMIGYVKESQKATADEMERGLFRRLLKLGAQLMVLFFAMRSSQALRETYTLPNGESVPYQSEHQRQYFSIFGKIAFWRPYFYRLGVGGATPLDQALALGEDCYSDLVRAFACYLGAGNTYGKVSECFAQVLDLPLSTQAIQAVIAEDAVDVATFYEQKDLPAPASEGCLLVAQADGKGVPMVRPTPSEAKVRLGKGEKPSQKKEAIVTGLYTIAPQIRTPARIVNNLFHPQTTAAPSADREAAHPQPQNKHLWATLDGKDAALAPLAQQAHGRDGVHIRHRIALTDGAEALQTRMQTHLPTFSLVLDFIHADEKLWLVANALFGERSPQRTPWVETHTLTLLEGHTAQLVAELRQLASLSTSTHVQQETLTKVANYFERNADFMHYNTYLTLGWPIASGVIEGACRHLVKDRCELSGMRWSQPGAETLLRLRSVVENGDWLAYQRFHHSQRFQRLYHCTAPTPDQPELLTLNQPDLAQKPLPSHHAFIMPTILTQRSVLNTKLAA